MILDLCAGSGAWSKSYSDAGYEVRHIDLAAGQDVRLVTFQKQKIHGILAAPPCTHLSGSGARWWKEKGPRALLEALALVDACCRLVLFHQPSWWALENPVGRLSRFLGPPVMTFQPWEYGDPWTKRTCLWGNFVPPAKTPVSPVEGGKIWKLSPSPERSTLRSITPPGFAKAFFKANP